MSNEFLDEFSKEEKFKIICNALLVTLMITFIIVNVVSIGRHKEQQAKVLLQREAAAITKHMTVFPDYKQSKIYKENQMASIPKISLDEVQAGGASITIDYPAGVNYFFYPDEYYTQEQAQEDVDSVAPGGHIQTNCSASEQWYVIPNSHGTDRGYAIASKEEFDEEENIDNTNGWSVSGGIPIGTYDFILIRKEGGWQSLTNIPAGTVTLGIPQNTPVGTWNIIIAYCDSTYVDQLVKFKITPPCPTVKLTVTRKK